MSRFTFSATLLGVATHWKICCNPAMNNRHVEGMPEVLLKGQCHSNKSGIGPCERPFAQVLIISVSTSTSDADIEPDNGEWQFRFSGQTRENTEVGRVYRITDKGKARGLIK